MKKIFKIINEKNYLCLINFFIKNKIKYKQIDPTSFLVEIEKSQIKNIKCDFVIISADKKFQIFLNS